MSAKLILSISQNEENVKPYTFKMTNIKVYSFEEALFHCYTYWKQSVDDFTSDDFTAWVANDLSLSMIASNIRELKEEVVFSKKFIAFLTFADYFEYDKIENLKKELLAWESRKEWEKYKERGDYLINHGEYEKAFIMYKKAVLCSPDIAEIHNNAAISLMKQGLYSEATDYLLKAVSLSPNNVDIILNLAEAQLLNGYYDSARQTLKKAELYGENSGIPFFYGQIEFFSGNYKASIPYFEDAISINHNPHYIYCLSDVYVKLRQYDKALETMESVKIKDRTYLKKLAEFYVEYNNIPAAIKCMEEALASDEDNVDLWTRLASYHRLDYDLNRAYSAIIRALNISKNNAKANLEYAQIRKAQGRIKDYQVILHEVLNGFKESYRENFAIE